MVDEDVTVYFRNAIKEELHKVSYNIYDFLESDIFKLTDLEGKKIL